ncbi:hypothetical protein TWF694_010462 [Orbilia ellipsospora]|uniref:Uncharacterized protein n=1 Tax=Orbilia ellipsospora TaxID=2528407 RepID=A0AAV9XB42_9PEZI
MRTKILSQLQADDNLGSIPYQVYLRRGNLAEGFKPGALGEPKLWHGNAQSLIIHAGRIFGSACSRDWLPSDIEKMRAELMSSYSREPWNKTSRA